jgi:CBS domain-containing protein
MRRDVLTVCEDDPINEVLDALVGKHIHGAPVVNSRGELVGLISQVDLHFGMITRSPSEGSDSRSSGGSAIAVKEVMTAPAVAANEETKISDLCKMMHRLRIHRVPIVNDGKVTGMISSLDICGAVGRGETLV